MKNYLPFIGIAVVVAAAGVLGWWHGSTELPGDTPNPSQPTETECPADAQVCPDGSTVGRTGPECSFAECPAEPVPDDVQAQIDEYTDRVRLQTPPAGSYIASPLSVRGEARGTWFFEGDFTILLTDWDGEIIAEDYVTADGEWMTEDFVSFSGEMEFTNPYEPGNEASRRGWLILQRANPSGLPENDAAVEVPVWFANPTNE